MDIEGLKRVEAGLQEYKFPPQIVIETTAYCNYKCIMCAHKDMTRTKGKMAMPLYKKIIREIAAENRDTEVWMTWYGEALHLGYRLYYMIQFAKREGLTNVVLNTNAMFLSDEAADWLIDSGLDLFIISMDAYNKETYERIRVGGDFEVVRSNAINMLDKLRKRALKRPKFVMQFSVMDENESEVDDFKSFWLSQGAHVKVRQKLSWTGEIQANNLKVSDYRIPCPWLLRTAGIHWNGDMVVCVVDFDGKYVAGNLQAQSIKEIWNTSLKEVRAKHWEKRFDEAPRVCRDCLDWQAVGAVNYSPQDHQ